MIIYYLLHTIKFLHERCGIMHRDLKSDNIMLTDEPELKPILIDFSI